MAVSIVAFSLKADAYQDVSGGFEACAFRQPHVSQKDNVIRVHLGTVLPVADTADFDEYSPPQSDDEERQLHFYQLTSTDRIYVRAGRAPVTLRVYRK